MSVLLFSLIPSLLGRPVGASGEVAVLPTALRQDVAHDGEDVCLSALQVQKVKSKVQSQQAAAPDIVRKMTDPPIQRAFETGFDAAAELSGGATPTCKEGYINSCLCTNGANDSYCCMDQMENPHSGGAPVPGISSVELSRNGSTWYCTSENQCSDYDASQVAHPGNDGVRGQDAWFAPPTATCSSPRIMYIHGGSWTSGSPTSDGYFRTGSRLANMTGAIVMSIDYPMPGTCYTSPDGPCEAKSNFSVVINFSVEALEYLASNVPPIPGVDGIPAEGCHNDPLSAPPILIGGDSSGAGTAYSVVLTVAPGGPYQLGWELSGAFLWSGFYDLQCDTISYVEKFYSEAPKADGGIWHIGAVDGAGWATTPAEYAYWNCFNLAINYAGNVASTLNPYASTVLANSSMLQGLPPMYMSVSGAYALLAENQIVAQNAAYADLENEVYLDVYPGQVHDFQMYSEGCGAPVPLWQGQMVWARTATFVKAVASTGHAPCPERLPHGFSVQTTFIPKVPVPKGSAGEPDLPYPGATFGC